MTEAEKKMKKYTNAIERRLNLPRDVRARVMSDFVTAIQARREAGRTDAEIYAELGSPKRAAAELNEQMKEFAYRKSPWRFVFAGAAIASGIWLVLYQVLQCFGLLLSTFSWQLFPNPSASIGIIGGADGPTAVFVTRAQSFDWEMLLVAALMIGCIWAYRRLCRCNQK
ncbi:MAG: hypothetical protein IJB59_00610 [Oscillospiraceae bacterium]|nr:hypothetical protein [Oscillospiraceae bacterium]